MPTAIKGRKAAIMIVDDHVMVRQGVAELINREPDMMVCCGAASVDEALNQIQRRQSGSGCCGEASASCPLPDMAIVDLSLNGVSGQELVRILKSRYPEIPALVMSMHDENLHAERALRAGAKGYIMKHEAFDQVLLAIRQVLRGETYLSESMRSKLLQRFLNPADAQDASPVARLSDRELEVLRFAGAGLTSSEIAEKLHRSIKTVEANRANIKEKLNLKSNNDFLRFAVQWVAGETEANEKPSFDL